VRTEAPCKLKSLVIAQGAILLPTNFAEFFFRALG
jgi:hypothetical protein